MKLKKADDHLREELKDPYFRELYELEMQKVGVIKKIIEYRIKHKLNQKQLAQKAGVSQQHISKIETGEFSNVTTLEKILLHIGFTVKIQAVPLSRKVASAIEERCNEKNMCLRLRGPWDRSSVYIYLLCWHRGGERSSGHATRSLSEKQSCL